MHNDQTSVDLTSNASCVTSNIANSNNLKVNIFCDTNTSASLENLANENIRIFPNPSNGKITIQGIPVGYTSLELVDHTGKILTKKAFKNVKITEEFSDIVPGIYHLKFTGEGQITFTKSIEIQ